MYYMLFSYAAVICLHGSQCRGHAGHFGHLLNGGFTMSAILSNPVTLPAFSLVDRVNCFVAAIEATIDHRNEGTAIKGATLLAAHKVYDGADRAALLAIADSLPAYKKGGDKVKNAASKLCNRYHQVAVFLGAHGLDFTAIGGPLDEKRTVSVNLVETIKKALGDAEHAHHAAALQWSADKVFLSYLDNCQAIDADNDKAEFRRLAEASKAEAKIQLDAMAAELATMRAELAKMASKAKAAKASKKAAA
jgi:hypothetical protein